MTLRCSSPAHTPADLFPRTIERFISESRYETKPDAQTAAAVFQLGHLYETGRGVPVDLERARQILTPKGKPA